MKETTVGLVQSQLSVVNSGDTVLIVGDTLQNDAINDWWQIKNYILNKYFVLILETNNKKVPGWQINNMNMTSIISPNIEVLEHGAFYESTNLRSVHLPKTKMLEQDAFHQCSNLTTVELPEVLTIGDNAFNQCSGLTAVNFPNLQTMGDNVFFQCSNLTTVELPEIQTIGNNAFNQCSGLTVANFPNLQTMGANVFFQCSNLTSAGLPRVTTVGDQALQYCTNLTNVDVSSALTIGMNAFSGCSGLTSIDLPEVTIINSSAFAQCSDLTNVIYPNVQTIGDCAFMGTNLPSVILPNVQTIGKYAFQNCTNITTLSIPKVTTIQEGAFNGCTGLTSLYMPYVQTLGNWSFGNCTNLELVFLPNLSTFGDWTFTDCPALKYMELGVPPFYVTDAFGGSTGPILIVVPDTNAYNPFPLVTPYSSDSEVNLRKVSTDTRMFNPDLLETLVPLRNPNAVLAGRGTFVWKKDGYPIPGANSSSYTPKEPGWYTLEFTHGGTVILQSVYLAAEMVEVADSRARFVDCTYTLVLTFTPSGADRTVTVSTKGSGSAYVKDIASGKLFKDGVTYKLPKNKTMLEIPYETVTGMGDNNEVQFEWEASDFPIVYDTDVFTLYDAYEIMYRYIRPTVGYRGLLEVEITGGSPYVERSLDGGKIWEWARDPVTGASIPFTQSQIYNLEVAYLLYRQSNTCTPVDTLRLYNDHDPAIILREVLMPSVTDAVCSVAAGEHYVHSQSNFTFTLTGVKASYSLHVTTSRTMLPDSEGVLVERNEDGSFTVTILKIQEPVVVFIDFTVGNSSVEGMHVWGADGVLHLQSVESCEALIHSLSGTLMQRVRLLAGEDYSLSLTRGIYFVTIGEKMYKVIL